MDNSYQISTDGVVHGESKWKLSLFVLKVLISKYTVAHWCPLILPILCLWHIIVYSPVSCNISVKFWFLGLVYGCWEVLVACDKKVVRVDDLVVSSNLKLCVSLIQTFQFPLCRAASINTLFGNVIIYIYI